MQQILQITVKSGPIDLGPLDHLGRFRLDRQALTELGWRQGQHVCMEVLADGSGVLLRLTRNVCAHCGAGDEERLVVVTPESRICQRCLDAARWKAGRGGK